MFRSAFDKLSNMENSKGCLLGFVAALAYTIHNVMMKVFLFNDLVYVCVILTSWVRQFLASASGQQVSRPVPVFEQHTTFCLFLFSSGELSYHFSTSPSD